jgi:hypothetical protein
MRAALREHEELVLAIERGDPRVTGTARKHLEAIQLYISKMDRSRMVTATRTVFDEGPTIGRGIEVGSKIAMMAQTARAAEGGIG